MRQSRVAMKFARTFGTVALTAALAACSGNLGGGESTLPGGPGSLQNGSNVQQAAQAAPSPSPVAASDVATLGAAPTQPLPAIDGWGGSIAFPSPAPTASPRLKASAAPAAPAATIGITSSVVAPSDAPHFGTTGKRHAKHDPAGPAPLFYISLLATADVTFAQLPRIVIDVPREVAARHQNDTFALALYDPSRKDKSFQLGAALRDLDATPPPDSAIVTPVPLPSPTPSGPPLPLAAFTPPPLGTGLAASSLPPQPMTFLATPVTLALKENVAVVFALYAIAPSPTPSDTPAANASPAASGSPQAAPAWSWGPAAVPLPAGSMVPSPGPAATATPR